MAWRSGYPLLDDDPVLFDVPPERLLVGLPGPEVRDDGIGLRSLIARADAWCGVWTTDRKHEGPRARAPRARQATRSRGGLPQAA